MYMSVCLHASMYLVCMFGAYRRQKRASHVLKLGLDGCEVPCGSWDLSLVLRKNTVLLPVVLSI